MQRCFYGSARIIGALRRSTAVILHCVALIEHHSLHSQSGNRRRKVTVFVLCILPVSTVPFPLGEQIIC